jgi:DNA (cytosine-5)-methyltransferase 1
MGMRTVDLFAGGGGLTLGFARAGFNVVAAFDSWDAAVELYRKNFKEHPIIKADLESADVEDEIREYKPEIIIGGPPCQDFSSAGKRDETLGRANLTKRFAIIISELKPKFFLMENVDRAIKSRTFEEAKGIFKEAGYGITIKILDASLCGVPQLRKRVFVVGELNGEDDFLGEALKKGVGKRPMTVREYFGKELNIEHYYRHPRSYARRGVFSIDEPSPTIRGVNRPIPAGYPGHPGDSTSIGGRVRPLTTRERSMIQTFPKWFILEGSKTDVEQIIGNAVPVKLAEHVGKRLREYIKKRYGKKVGGGEGKNGSGDCFSKNGRSAVMRAVKSEENKSTEIRLMNVLRKRGIRGWRRRQRVEGKPDFVFKKERVAIYTDGCFWHGHGCRKKKPETNREYWEKKIKNNMERDKRNNMVLRGMGWRVVRVWECEIEKKEGNRKVTKIEKLLKSQ